MTKNLDFNQPSTPNSFYVNNIRTSDSNINIPAGRASQSDERINSLYESIVEVQSAMDNQITQLDPSKIQERNKNLEDQVVKICSLYTDIIKKPGINSRNSIERLENHMLGLIKSIQEYDAYLEKNLAKSIDFNSTLKSFLAKQFTEIRAQTDKAGSPAERVAVRVAEARLVSSLGVGPKKTQGGATGSITYEGFDGKRIGIFKPKQENVNTKRKVEHAVKKWIGWNRQVSHCRDQGKIPAMYSEISASVADSYFGTNLVPATRFAKLNGLEGSFMAWSDDHVEAVDYKAVKGMKIASKQEKEKEVVEFQKMVIFDYLIGNLDRHDKNWIIQQDAKGNITSVKAIDNANAFLTSNPGTGGEDRVVRQKQYAWKNFFISKEAFNFKDPEIKEIFGKLKAENSVELLIEELRTELLKHNSEEEVNAFLSPEMISHLEQRIQVLRKLETCSPVKYPLTPQFLASLSSEEAISAFLET